MKKYVFYLMFFSLISATGYSQRVYVADNELNVDLIAYQDAVDYVATGNEDSWYVETDASESLTEAGATADDKVTDCKCKGVALYGRVKIVNSFPDFKIKVVDSFPDLRVRFVDSFPDECGRWKIVDSFPDFTIQYVESFPDFTIKIVESFPGMP